MAVYHILEGKGRFTIDEHHYSVSPGAIIITPEGAARGIETETTLVFMATRVE